MTGENDREIDRLLQNGCDIRERKNRTKAGTGVLTDGLAMADTADEEGTIRADRRMNRPAGNVTPGRDEPQSNR